MVSYRIPCSNHIQGGCISGPSSDGNTRNQIDYISIAQRWKTSLTDCRIYPGADSDTDHQLLVATLKVRLCKRQRQNSIPPLNLEEIKEDKAVQFAAEVTNRFTALEAAQNEVTPEDLWKGTVAMINYLFTHSCIFS